MPVAAVLVAIGTAACGSRHDFDTPVAAPGPVAPVEAASQPAAVVPVPAPAAVLTGESFGPPVQAAFASPPAPADLATVGRIIVPRLGLDAPLLVGDTLDVLDHGPGHRIGSAQPGQVGNVVVAGHRTTRTRPFRDLDQLQPGDVLSFQTASGTTYRYDFVQHDVVSPSAGEITDQPYGYIATLYACHPPGSARSRIVAYFRLASAPETGQPDPSTMPPVPIPFA